MAEGHQPQADRIRAEGAQLDCEAEAREAIARSWERDPACAHLALMDAQAWATLALVRELHLIRKVLQQRIPVRPLRP